MDFCYCVLTVTVTFQKSLVRFTTSLVYHNHCQLAKAYITFVFMQHNKAKYFIEPVIHALFWLGVYYTLNSLTAASFNMVSYNNGRPTGGFSANMLFPYPLPVLGFLMVMFYGNIFWLLKKLICYKKKIVGVAVIGGCFVLLFATNYLVVRMRTVPSGGTYQRDYLVVPDRDGEEKIAFSLKRQPTFQSDSIVSDSSFRSSLHIPLSPPPPPPEMSFTANDWLGMQQVMALFFLAILGTAVAYFFIKEWISNNLARSQAEAQQLSTEVKFLRGQVNPHFLFNTLNNLADSISKLSGMMRYMIYESNTDSVPLQKEIEYLQDCIALNKLRYAGNEVSVSFVHPAQAAIAGVQIAPMLFIAFLENAFKHGVLIGHNSSIAIAISVNQKKLAFTCENADYSAVKKLAEESTGIGLENVKRRLELVYPDKHELQAGPEAGKYIVNLEINLA
jgi:hypothetical protein